MNKSQLAVVDRAISIPGVKVTPVGLEIDESLSEEQLSVVFACLHRVTNATNWMWGDALAFAGRKWGNRHTDSKYDEANQITGVAIPTLKAAKFTAEHIPAARRRPKLTFTHHLEIAFAYDDPAIQDNWLDRAIKEKLSASQLRREIRLDKKEIHEETNPDPDKHKHILARITLVEWANEEDPEKWPEDQVRVWIDDLLPIEEFRHRLIAIQSR